MLLPLVGECHAAASPSSSCERIFLYEPNFAYLFTRAFFRFPENPQTNHSHLVSALLGRIWPYINTSS